MRKNRNQIWIFENCKEQIQAANNRHWQWKLDAHKTRQGNVKRSKIRWSSRNVFNTARQRQIRRRRM